MDVRGAPGVGVVAPRVGAGPDRHEAEVALLVGQAAADAAEVRVDRARPVVPAVAVAAAGVGLPDLDQRVRHRRARRPPHVAVDDDPLALRLALVLAGEVVVELAEPVLAEDRRGRLGQPLRERDQRLLRVPQPRRLVARVVERGMRRVVAGRSSHGLQHDREALADADADRRDAVLPAVGLERVGERAEDAPAGRAERVADRDRAAVDVDLLGVEVLPLADAGERLARRRPR